ncbi:hypothetical protein QHH11_00945 [Aphanizomenon sp. PH219]|nr:hypothetical protein [Aphanizomenon sp. PH219]
MTFNRVPQWQQSLDPKLVRRLNNPLMKQGVIDGRMARRIIERSPDILEKLPLLAQQMQRWSTNIHLESESTPIVYVQHQEQRSQAVEQQTINPNFASPDSSQGNKQVLIVNAKSIPVDMDLSNQDQMTPLVNQRSQSTELTLPPDNSLPNLPNNISSTPSESPIQRKAETPTNLPIVNVNSEQSSSLTENPQIPLVQQLAPTISNIEKPLVNLANNISSTPSESPIQRKTETPANLPIVNVNSEQSSSLTENPQITLVQQLAPTISNIEKPLVNLANNISSTPSESPIQRKTETPANLPIVNVNSEQSSSLTENPQIPLVQQLAPTISNIEKPLVNLANNISSTSEGISTNTNNRSSPSTSVIPIIDGSISKIKPKLENSVVVYSQPISPKLAANEPMLLIEEFKRNNPLVVTNGNKRVEKITQSTVANAQSKLPVVKINSEPSLPEFESLVLSTSPSAKKKASTLNSSQLTSQMNLGTTTNYNVTSSPAETSITNNIASNQGIMASTPSINSQLLKVNQINQTSIAGVSRPPQIDVDDLADKVERKIMRRLVVESERRGKNKWR